MLLTDSRYPATQLEAPMQAINVPSTAHALPLRPATRSVRCAEARVEACARGLCQRDSESITVALLPRRGFLDNARDETRQSASWPQLPTHHGAIRLDTSSTCVHARCMVSGRRPNWVSVCKSKHCLCVRVALSLLRRTSCRARVCATRLSQRGHLPLDALLCCAFCNPANSHDHSCALSAQSNGAILSCVASWAWSTCQQAPQAPPCPGPSGSQYLPRESCRIRSVVHCLCSYCTVQLSMQT